MGRPAPATGAADQGRRRRLAGVTSPLLRLFYVSKALPSIDNRAVGEILHISRRNNARRDVTGCLLFTGRFFAQMLEGDAAVVEVLALRIAADPSHSDVRITRRSHATLRLYDNWSMGYVYALPMQDRIAQLYDTPSPDELAIDTIIGHMRPDSVLGPLT